MLAQCVILLGDKGIRTPSLWDKQNQLLAQLADDPDQQRSIAHTFFECQYCQVYIDRWLCEFIQTFTFSCEHYATEGTSGDDPDPVLICRSSSQCCNAIPGLPAIVQLYTKTTVKGPIRCVQHHQRPALSAPERAPHAGGV